MDVTCPMCLGTRQAFPVEYDVVNKTEVIIHADNSCPACKVPLVKLARGYRCQQACEPRSMFVRAWRDRDGTRWATYRCVAKGHEWDTTVKRQDYEMLTEAVDTFESDAAAIVSEIPSTRCPIPEVQAQLPEAV